ncbi:MAG: flagellar basal body P-ring formation chaperone FlgA [Candidatus Margulisiibacteriota bacterium]
MIFRYCLISLIILFLSLPALSQPNKAEYLTDLIKEKIQASLLLCKTASVNVNLLNLRELEKFSASDYIVSFVDNNELLSGYSLQPRIVIPLNISNNGRIIKRINMPVQINIFQKVAVSSQLIKKNELFSTENINLVTMNITVLPKEVFSSISELNTYEPRYSIGPDRVISKVLVRQIPLIKNGAAVSLIFKEGRIAVKAEGVARADGLFGETIRVQNNASKEYLTGRVLDEDTVLVE